MDWMCLLVAGGKGGVGKSTVTAGLARSLVRSGLRIGVLDADLSGPNQALLFDSKPLQLVSNRIEPAFVDGVSLVSLGGVARAETALIWSTLEIRSTLGKLIRDVSWGSLDMLIVDMPPGCGTVQLVMHELLPMSSVLLVTTGSPLALADCLRQVTFYRDLQMAVLGVVENLAYFPCPQCRQRYAMYDPEAVARMARTLDLRILGRLPWSKTVGHGQGMEGLTQMCRRWLQRL